MTTKDILDSVKTQEQKDSRIAGITAFEAVLSARKFPDTITHDLVIVLLQKMKDLDISGR